MPKKLLKLFSFASSVLIIVWVTIFIERISLAQRSSTPKNVHSPSTAPAPYYPNSVIPSSPNIQRSPAPESFPFLPDGHEPRLLPSPQVAPVKS